ncbi:MAG: TonB family protein [Deltaproteobacteria bacterium]|nr:TonB family protein [Deltaproteobacteria bacterium]
MLRWGVSAATAVTAHGLLLILPSFADTPPKASPSPAPAVTLTLVALAPPQAEAEKESRETTATPVGDAALVLAPDPVDEAIVDAELPDAELPDATKPRRLVVLGEGPVLPDPVRAEHFAQRAQHAEADTRAEDELPAEIVDEANTSGVVASTGARAQRVNTAREDPQERRGEDIADAGEGEDRLSPKAATGAATDGQAKQEAVRPPEERVKDASLATNDAAEDAAEDPSDEQTDALAQLIAPEPPRPPTPSRPAVADRDAPPPAPSGERPVGERLQAPAPPPTPETAAPPPPPPPASPQSAPIAERLGPANPGQTDGDGDGEGGRSARPDEPIITLPGAPHVAGAGAPSSPAARLDLQTGEVSQVSTVADPLAIWLGEVHKVARVGFSEAMPVQLKLDGVEGSAEVYFCVSRRGKVWEATLTESSGVDGLDNAALSALPDRVPRPPEEAELRGLGACYAHAINFVQVNDRR